MNNNVFEKYSTSVIVPARDEAGTIEDIVKRVPKMGGGTELIFVEGFSSDDTWSEIQRVMKKNDRKEITVRAYKQEFEKGKKAATLLGFSKAVGDILIILDADLSVQPEKLSDFYFYLASGKATFVNGSRFIYRQEDKAMRFLNTIGNRFFSLIFSLLLRQKITDTLCGTKALFRKDWKRIQHVTEAFSHHDPYGDFQLFLGAGLLGLKIEEVPVKYFARVYGTTKISRFRDGFKLLKIVAEFATLLSRRLLVKHAKER